MPSYAAPKKRQPPRVLLLLVGVFVVVAVVVVATHKSSTTTAASGGRPTTTAIAAKSPPAGGKTKATPLTKPTTTAGGAKTTTKGRGAKPRGKTANPPTTVPGLRVLFDIQGAGNDTIGRFPIAKVDTPWGVNWSYNCSKLGKKGGFDYTVVSIRGARPGPTDRGPHQTGMSGSGLERYDDSGTFGMAVTTECTWTVEISETSP
jgi:hypothetical protein